MRFAEASATTLTTVRDEVLAALARCAEFNPADETPPAAILWADESAAWASAVRLLSRDVAIVSLGDYTPDTSSGPVAYLRMIVAQHEAGRSDEDTPIVVYLPGVSRRQLADPESLPEDLRPLAGLAVRAEFFSQRNGTDWTPYAYFVNASHGLGLSVSADRDTKRSLERALPRLLDVKVAGLRGRDLTGIDFDALILEDPVRTVLRWLSDPAQFQHEANNEGAWAGFVSLASRQYKVHPEKDGPLTAAVKMADREGPWRDVWSRYVEAPRAYPGVPDLLRRAKPDDVLPLYSDAWPQDNDDAEAALLGELDALAGEPLTAIREGLRRLDGEHGSRRRSVWAELGDAPMALVLAELVQLSSSCESVAAGSAVDDLARGYASSGWHADDAFVRVLGSLPVGHHGNAVVNRIAETIYRPWLDATVSAFQVAWTTAPPRSSLAPPRDEGPGTCLMFVDGLRFDVAMAVAAELERRGIESAVEWHITAVPTITSTCKPMVSPVADTYSGGAELTPRSQAGALYSLEQLKRDLAAHGWAFVPADSEGSPDGRAWTEGGDIDKLGHTLGPKLPQHLPGQVTMLAARVTELIAAGWSRVRLVTDHGWLLLPSQLPKHALPEHLTVIRKGRCAQLRDGVQAPAGVRVLPWSWDDDVPVGLAPGIHAFEKGKAYEHGGLSPQESVVPVLTVETGTDAPSSATLRVDFSWVNLVLQVEVEGAPEGSQADLRTKANEPGSSVVRQPKVIKNGKARLMASDEFEGAAAILVVVGPDETPLANRPTQIPEG